MDRLILAQELQALTEDQLKALLHEVHRALARSRPGSHECRNALASLENIQRVLAQRIAKRSPSAPSP